MINRNLKPLSGSGSFASLQDDRALGASDVTNAINDQKDKWYEQLLKYIPAESLSLYIAMEGVVKGAADGTLLAVLLGICLLLGGVFNVLYLRYVWKVTRAWQIVISTIALVVYIYSIGGFFAAVGIYLPVVGSLLLVATTAFLSLAPGPKKPA